MKTYNEEQKKSSAFLDKAAKYMTEKLQKAAIWQFTAFSDGEIRQTPSSIRGNASYAYFQSFRIDEIQQKICEKLLTNGKTLSNTLFLTHTLRYSKNDEKDILRVWKEGHEAIPKLIRSMRKAGMIAYCVSIEAFEEAGFHIHLAVVLDHVVGMKKHVKVVKGKVKITYRLTDKRFEYFIREAWAKAAGKDLDEAHSDIQACYSSDLAGYIMKELKKASCVEKSLKRYRQGEDSEADRKKIQAFYMADRLKIRLFRASRSLSSAQDAPEGQIPQEADLITIRNNSTEENKAFPVFSFILTRKQLYSVFETRNFCPFSGFIDKDTVGYGKMREFIEKRIGFSELLADKEKMKRFLEEKEIKMKERNTTFEIVKLSLEETA